jgi:hypothetical protein
MKTLLHMEVTSQKVHLITALISYFDQLYREKATGCGCSVLLSRRRKETINLYGAGTVTGCGSGFESYIRWNGLFLKLKHKCKFFVVV